MFFINEMIIKDKELVKRLLERQGKELKDCNKTPKVKEEIGSEEWKQRLRRKLNKK